MSLSRTAVAKRQFAVITLFLILFAIVFAMLVAKDRQQEWRLRQEQASHRLQLAFELVNRDLKRVRSDVLQVANQSVVRGFTAGDVESRLKVQSEFTNFLRFKPNYQQIRLVDRTGQELVRADRLGEVIQLVTDDELQDKSDRYYIRDSATLAGEQVFVSEFDLNQERGSIEQPLNPVIRFVAAVDGSAGSTGCLLVINYRGAPLLDELRTAALPGKTLLLRSDGQYILAPAETDAWGWLLGHGHSFAEQFSDAWRRRNSGEGECFLNRNGAFAFRSVRLQQFRQPTDDKQDLSNSGRGLAANGLWVVSWLSADEVFSVSNRLLWRLLLVTACLMPPLFLLTRYWAVASVRRRQQNEQIQASEKKLRELSTRLMQIQEEERRSISRELHDQLGQQVTALNLDLKLAQREPGSPDCRGQLQRAIEESELLLSALHDFAIRIRPDVLDDLGLHDAIESHLWEFENRTDIPVNFDSGIQDIEVPPIVAENVFRLIQESLNNVFKHARASRVEVSVGIGAAGGLLHINISDDGIGTSQSNRNSESMDNQRLGILGMKERVDLLGGEIEFLSEASQGTTVRVRIPLNDDHGGMRGNAL